MQMQTQTHQNSGRGGGGLMQLRAYGAPDGYLFARGGDEHPHNMRGSMHWFVGRADGLATADDIATFSLGGAGGASPPADPEQKLDQN